MTMAPEISVMTTGEHSMIRTASQVQSNRGASIISISWKSFRTTRSRVAVRPCHQTESANRGASIISISWKSFWTHNSISGSFNPQRGRFFDAISSIIAQIQQTAGRASSASAGHRFGLTTQSPGLSTPSKVAVRPYHSTDAANRWASIISIS